MSTVTAPGAGGVADDGGVVTFCVLDWWTTVLPSALPAALLMPIEWEEPPEPETVAPKIPTEATASLPH